MLKRRDGSWLWFAFALACGGAVSGCSRHEAEQVEQRRALLKPPDDKLAREEAARKRRIFDDDGDLIASDQSVAGLVLPRGLSPSMQFEHEWYFKSDRIPAAKLERFIAPHLFTGEIDRSVTAVEYVSAHIKDNPSAPPITVRIVTLSGAASASEIYIRQAVPAPLVRPREAEVEAQLKARREHAE
jgi:hypothetical protein